jgi:hypothetical protein
MGDGAAKPVGLSLAKAIEVVLLDLFSAHIMLSLGPTPPFLVRAKVLF